MYHKNHAKIQKKRKKIPPLFNIERFQQFKYMVENPFLLR